MTQVVNVKVDYIRPKYNNLKEWMQDPQNVYIGRKKIVLIDGVRFPPEDSLWANPFKIGRDGDRETVLIKYQKYIEEKIKIEGLVEDLLSLQGKKLGCWCKYNFSNEPRCHGDILVELINKYSD